MSVDATKNFSLSISLYLPVVDKEVESIVLPSHALHISKTIARLALDLDEIDSRLIMIIRMLHCLEGYSATGSRGGRSLFLSVLKQIGH